MRWPAVTARSVRNNRIADPLHQQEFSALSGSPGAMAYYRSLRARGTGHHAALRQLSNGSSASCTAASRAGRSTTRREHGATIRSRRCEPSVQAAGGTAVKNS
jgi:hypothetical protein